ncbi:odorant receptor 7a-like isoform X4 [Lycorma delicatula]|uniref:odorant receptor 7a-like isoform X4 n=1 Tax=Lycorma delicatula TaxID=130591 RepID=UPI003F510CA4
MSSAFTKTNTLLTRQNASINKFESTAYQRRVNELNKSLQIIASIVNQGACSIVCVNLYYFIEGENLRMMLWSCSWTAKPAWFKKFLLIIMISANKPLIVKPFGLYNLNLQNYSKVVNSAFSFYNLMKSLKKN